MTNLDWIRTLTATELSNWFYNEWLEHMQYAWSSSRGGLEYWLSEERITDTPQTDKVFEKKPTPIRDFMVNGKVKDEPQKHCHRPNNVACHPEQDDIWCRGCGYWYANEPQTERGADDE